MEKKSYGSPMLIIHGTVEQLTQGNASGDNLDASFPVNTPKQDLTFS